MGPYPDHFLSHWQEGLVPDGDGVRNERDGNNGDRRCRGVSLTNRSGREGALAPSQTYWALFRLGGWSKARMLRTFFDH